jgi:hypothetical protein
MAEATAAVSAEHLARVKALLASFDAGFARGYEAMYCPFP